jgi:hypothetical protein
MIRHILFGTALALAATGAASVAAPKKAAAARDWTKSVVLTPEGGYRVGNPAAAVKLIEYGSLTCNHCGNFAREGVPELLSRYVKNGRVSFEFRNFVRDPLDLTGALLSRCAGPANFFAVTDRIFATQEEWIGKVSPHFADIQALPPGERLARVSTLSGLGAMASKGGVTPAKATQCLNDTKAVEKLTAMRKVAVETYHLHGTPMFVLNGQKSEARSWAELKPLLGAPGG